MKESLRERVNRNAVVYVGVVAVTAFGLGFAACMAVKHNSSFTADDQKELLASLAQHERALASLAVSSSKTIDCESLARDGLTNLTISIVYTYLTAENVAKIKSCLEDLGSQVVLMRLVDERALETWSPLQPAQIYYGSAVSLEQIVTVRKIAEHMGRFEIERSDDMTITDVTMWYVSPLLDAAALGIPIN